MYTYTQWRRSVVKSEGSGSLRSSHQTRSRSKFVFVFGAENGLGLFGHFRLFQFSAENEFSLFYFSFFFRYDCYPCVPVSRILCYLCHSSSWHMHQSLTVLHVLGMAVSKSQFKCCTGLPHSLQQEVMWTSCPDPFQIGHDFILEGECARRN